MSHSWGQNQSIAASINTCTPHTDSMLNLTRSRPLAGTTPLRGHAQLNTSLSRGARLAPVMSSTSGHTTPGPSSSDTPSLHIATQILHSQHKSSVSDPYGASGPPLYQTATFAQPDATSFGAFDYTRSGNPTRCDLWTLYPTSRREAL